MLKAAVSTSLWKLNAQSLLLSNDSVVLMAAFVVIRVRVHSQIDIKHEGSRSRDL